MDGRSSGSPAAWKCNIRTNKPPRWKSDFKKSGRRPICRLPALACASLEVSTFGSLFGCDWVRWERNDTKGMDNLAKKAIRGLVQLIFGLGFFLFVPAWTLDFWQAWLWLLVFAVSAALITVYLW